MSFRQALTLVAAASIAFGFTAGPAIAHDRNGPFVEVARSTNQGVCHENKAEIDHNDDGYQGTILHIRSWHKLSNRDATSTGSDPCATSFVVNSRMRGRIYFRPTPDTGAWSVCKETPYQTKVDDVWGFNFPPKPDYFGVWGSLCGAGEYRTGTASDLQSNGWFGSQGIFTPSLWNHTLK